jgi:hypothetical protein
MELIYGHHYLITERPAKEEEKHIEVLSYFEPFSSKVMNYYTIYISGELS